MNPFKKIATGFKRKNANYQRNPNPAGTVEKSGNSFTGLLTNDDYFSNIYSDRYREDSFLYNAWVNIAVNILIRNLARADYIIEKDGEELKNGALHDLFHRPNTHLSRFDLWKATSAWWYIEGEAIWWFGPDYSGGIPKEIHVLNPRKMQLETIGSGGVYDDIMNTRRRWFYHAGAELVPIFSDEIIHFKDWNPWNPLRGVSPLVSLALELEQDFFANKANSTLLKNNAVPQGLLKTDQTLRPEEADAIERRWESKYGQVKAGRKIAVLGKGTSFEALTFSPDVVKLFELKRWNLYTILAKYGIPARVANISDRTTSLSGKDTKEQHSAFWQYTLIPLLRQFEQILETQFFMRFGLKESGRFDLWDIPELQENEDAQSKRDIAEINAGIKTINEVLKERGKEPKPWGDVWYRPRNMVATNGNKSGDGEA
ncbi:MAG: phage portal protein [Treponema sp.]|jgi:HK97 family phage portal protein|nr:phage portal protein [Treponema sp.]